VGNESGEHMKAKYGLVYIGASRTGMYDDHANTSQVEEYLERMIEERRVAAEKSAEPDTEAK
jgi:hypothetical protein